MKFDSDHMLLVPSSPPPKSKVALARERHGKPFAWEHGSTWTPRAVPVLTEWLQSRKREEVK